MSNSKSGGSAGPPATTRTCDSAVSDRPLPLSGGAGAVSGPVRVRPVPGRCPDIRVRVARRHRGGSAGRGEANRFGADLPEPRGDGLVVAARGGPRRSTTDEIPAAHFCQLGSRSHVDGGGGTPGRRLHEGPQ